MPPLPAALGALILKLGGLHRCHEIHPTSLADLRQECEKMDRVHDGVRMIMNSRIPVGSIACETA